MDTRKIEEGVRLILEGVGEDPDREGLRETPDRVARMYEEVFAGLAQDPAVHFEKTFDEHCNEMVLVRDISFYSMCEHHLVPFFGKAHIGYIPAADGRVCGLSKLARLVEVFAKRPQVLEAEHMCMSMRGVKKPGSRTVTSAVRGVFAGSTPASRASRSEAMSLILRDAR